MGREQPNPGRGQFDRQRQAVHEPADLDHGRRILRRQLEVRSDRLRPFQEQADGPAFRRPLDRRGVGGRERQRGHRQLPLTPHLEPRAARDEDLQRGANPQEVDHQRRRPGHVLEVVEQQQQFLRTQILAKAFDQCPAAHLLHAQRARHRGGDEGRVVDRGEVDEPHAVRERVDDLHRHLQPEPRLAGAAGPGERQEPRVGCEQNLASGRDVPFAADQRRELDG